MAHRLAPAVALLVLTMACGDPTGNTGCAANDPLTVAATVDGAAYCGQIDNAFVSNGNLNVASSNAASTLSVNFGAGATVGTQTIGPGVPLSFQVETSAGAIWIASGSVSGSSGSLTIVTLTATGATGTFSFVAQPTSGGATAATVVANGSFSVTF